MITKETATNIALAHREIETAGELLKQISEALAKGRNPDLRDAFGRPRGLELGVPSSDTSRTLFNVPWSMAAPIIEAHIAAQRQVIVDLTVKAVAEASA